VLSVKYEMYFRTPFYNNSRTNEQFSIFTLLLYIKNNENTYTFRFLRNHQAVCTSIASVYVLRKSFMKSLILISYISCRRNREVCYKLIHVYLMCTDGTLMQAVCTTNVDTETCSSFHCFNIKKLCKYRKLCICL
jgi:hypothetical protein